jgi:hypothetical protein
MNIMKTAYPRNLNGRFVIRFKYFAAEHYPEKVPDGKKL